MRPAVYGLLVLLTLVVCEVLAHRMASRVIWSSPPATAAPARSFPPKPPTPKACRCASACDPTGCKGACCEPIPCALRK